MFYIFYNSKDSSYPASHFSRNLCYISHLTSKYTERPSISSIVIVKRPRPVILCLSFAGDPINCLSELPSGHVINTYCWITYTFTLPGNNAKPVGTHVAHPGLGGDYGEKRYHSYYQWVPFMLFFQGVLFYLPHWMWKQWEEGKIRMISEGMRGTTMDSKQERQAKTERLVQYLMETMHLHNSYAAGYFFCEVLNFINTVSIHLRHLETILE